MRIREGLRAALGRSQPSNPGQTDDGIPISPLHGSTERMRAFWAPTGHFSRSHPATECLGCTHLKPFIAHRWWGLAGPLSSQTPHPGLVVTYRWGHTGLPFSYKRNPPGLVSLSPPPATGQSCQTSQLGPWDPPLTLTVIFLDLFHTLWSPVSSLTSGLGSSTTDSNSHRVLGI